MIRARHRKLTLARLVQIAPGVLASPKPGPGEVILPVFVIKGGLEDGPRLRAGRRAR